jgi:prepilin-type N-terminal cleavage/methylation domain-containing protein
MEVKVMKTKNDRQSIWVKFGVDTLRPFRKGLTLIELLVVIMILGIIMTMAIPRLRVISEDRSIREATRIVGSVFSRASQRALTDGAAGVCIELNPNIYDVDNVQYAGTALYTLRAVPNYPGEGATWTDYPRELEIPTPLQSGIVEPNDSISFNNNSIRYKIASVPPVPPGQPRITITLELGQFVILPPPPAQLNSFVVHRRPRLQESSRIELPEGYIIDLRFSGELVPNLIDLPVSGSATPRSIFHNSETNDPSVTPPMRDRRTRVYFERDGSVEDYSFKNVNNLGESFLWRPRTDLYFFVSRYETDATREQIRSPVKTADDSLDSPSNMWLTVNVRTGSANISYSAPPLDPSLTLADRIRRARSIAVTGSSAGD